jgi:transcriptional regulator with XRE-family HTH domain
MGAGAQGVGIVSHKRNGSPLAKIRLRAKLEQGQVAEAVGIRGGKAIFSRYETGRELLPAAIVEPLSRLYRVTRKRVAWAAVLTFRRGITMDRYADMVKKSVDTTSELA